MRRIDRRDFGKEAALAFLSGVAVTVSGCGGGSSYSSGSPTAGTPPPAAGPSDEVGTISANHGHTAVIEGAKIAAGGAIQLDITGSAGHPHMVSLPAEAMSDIKAGKAVELKSTTNDGHDHIVTFNADNPAPPTRY
jgi:hypothetical protein